MWLVSDADVLRGCTAARTRSDEIFNNYQRYSKYPRESVGVKFFKNRLRFDEVTRMGLVSSFLYTGCLPL